MRVVSSAPLQLLCFTDKIEPPGDTMIAVAKATFDLRPGNVAELSDEQQEIAGGEQLFEDELGNSCRMAGDVAPYKPNADLLLTGHCHPPNGKATTCPVRFQVGSWKKELTVFGDRYWVSGNGSRQPVGSEPEPFEAMPIRYERALGDAESPLNPHGRGFAAEQSEDGRQIWPLPNIEYPDRPMKGPEDRPPPAGLTPLGMMIPSRLKKRGTYDEKWMRRRYPFPPLDIDWSCHNAAPPDQQAEGYLAGDEMIRLDNLVKDHPELESRLPGLKPRWFLSLLTPKRRYFFEVAMNLDTLWIDADEAKVVLVWRGQAKVPQKRDSEEDGSFFLLEPLEGPHQSREDAWATYRDAIDPPEPDLPEPALGEAEKKQIAGLLEQARGELKKGGVPDDLMETLGQETDPDRFQEILVDWLKQRFDVT